MGKKKKFIDKKNAQHFTLVHRSQRDPLTADEESSRHVLIPSVSAAANNLNSKEENEKYGIYFEDDYNYMQHLKERGSGVLVLSDPIDSKHEKDRKTFGNISLPSEVLPSAYEEDVGMLNLGVLPRGPQPDWDPDIVAALDDGVDFDDPDNFLDDDFIKIANSEGNESNNLNIVDQKSHGLVDNKDDIETEENDVASDVDSDDLFSDEFSYSSDDDDTKSRFTNYSMTSSVIRRTEGLKMIDDHFEKIMEEYDEEEIGAVDHEELPGFFNAKSEIVDSILNEYIETNKLSSLPQNEDGLEIANHVGSEDDDDDDDDDENIFSQFEKKPKNEWDCESFISTYSNLYNHPKLLDVKTPNQKKITLHKKTGIPVDVFNKKTPENADIDILKLPEKLNNVRLKDETIEEKKKRKQQVKEQRKNRRIEKKNNKTVFKNELKKQEKSSLNTACQKGIKI